jgi:non-canonical (house-cleaning) NTP pyrophosphatase
MRVIVGSESPRKIDAVTCALRSLSREAVVSGAPIASGVPETPWDGEIPAGARNRAVAARAARPEADLWIGLETGLVHRHDAVYEETWCCALTAEGRECLAYSSGLRVPAFVLARMEALGLSHCDAMTVIERELGLPNDTWGSYTGGVLRRETALAEAARNALAQALCVPSGPG